MRTVLLLAGLVLIATSCTGEGKSSSPSGSLGTTPPTVQPSPSNTALPHEGLSIGARSRTEGWVVMADGFGVNVAGGGGWLQNVDPKTGRTSKVARIGGWDTDFTHLGRYGEGSLWLTSGQELWFIGGSPHYAIGRHYDLHRLGFLASVLQASPSAGGGTWVVATGDGRRSGLVAEFDPDSGSIIRRFELRGGPGAITDAERFIIAGSGSAIVRIDPRTGRTRTKHLVGTPGGLASSGDRIWWTSGGGAVNCLLVHELTDCGTVYVPRATTLSSDRRSLWVLAGGPGRPATVTLVNGVTGEALAGPLELPHHGPASLTSYNGHAWVGFHDSGDVVRIDRDTAAG